MAGGGRQKSRVSSFDFGRGHVHGILMFFLLGGCVVRKKTPRENTEVSVSPGAFPALFMVSYQLVLQEDSESDEFFHLALPHATQIHCGLFISNIFMFKKICTGSCPVVQWLGFGTFIAMPWV